MQRIMTEGVGRNFKRGRIYDLPLVTWKHLEAQAGKPLKGFSERMDDSLQHSQRQEAHDE